MALPAAAADQRIEVTVPHMDGRALRAGEVLKVAIPPKRKERPSDRRRRQQAEAEHEERRQRARLWADEARGS